MAQDIGVPISCGSSPCCGRSAPSLRQSLAARNMRWRPSLTSCLQPFSGPNFGLACRAKNVSAWINPTRVYPESCNSRIRFGAEQQYYLLTPECAIHKITRSFFGAIAQLGERVNGIHEVGSSILPGSTNNLFRTH